MTPTFIGIDMDGPVADFSWGVEQLAVEPGLAEILDVARTQTPPPRPHPLTNAHWDAIFNAGAAFWASLPPIEERFPNLLSARALFDEMASLVGRDNVAFVTAVSNKTAETSASGKIAWLRKYLGNGFDNFVITRAEQKRFLAHPSAVLIDDHPRNCKEWRDAGGVDIYFDPTTMNALGSPAAVLDNIVQRIRAA
jgi:hypothetical protein